MWRRDFQGHGGRGRFGWLGWELSPGWIWVYLVAAGGWLAAGQVWAGDEFDAPPIEYSTTQPSNVVSELDRRWAAGKIEPVPGNERERVRWLLRELKVPEASQILVFSQTSLQNDRIRPGHPRALYFNDETYVGWVPGGLAEVTPIDPRLGPVFYIFDPHQSGRRPSGDDKSTGGTVTEPRFRREADCLRCHGTFVRDIPSVFARSVMVDSEGRPIGTLGGKMVDPSTPFEERWGGWYVTGTHGRATHRGNVFPVSDGNLRDDRRGDPVPENPARGANITNLSAFFDTSQYLAPGSDLVALLVFEHQLAVHNAITHAGQHVRRQLHYQAGIQRGLAEAVTTEPVYDSVRRAVASSSQDVLDALLSFDEAPLPDGGVAGAPAFRAVYEAGGPRSRDGRSLRQLDLRTRVFRYRCSPLIYSDSFAALPAPVHTAVLRRLKGVLTSLEADSRYLYLQPAERRLLREILRETLPAYAAVDP